ncbi:hypothetical protein CK556_03430 [Mesoplasma chauliocola]|uniref:Uncharacterized protein n=1 Tax=Mesoplasma chauliocola TaxID=216427 RepID=A0A249SPB8_9MOLU|nr:hypothetical protein CK556_03430 [Mesoplasma chauliocola]
MDILKRALSTAINLFLAVITIGILPLILWLCKVPQVGQLIFKTPKADTRGSGLIYFQIYMLLTGFIIFGWILMAIWCLMGRQPLALEITNWLQSK